MSNSFVQVAPIDGSLDWSANYANMMGFSDPEFIELMRLYLTIHRYYFNLIDHYSVFFAFPFRCSGSSPLLVSNPSTPVCTHDPYGILVGSNQPYSLTNPIVPLTSYK